MSILRLAPILFILTLPIMGSGSKNISNTIMYFTSDNNSSTLLEIIFNNAHTMEKSVDSNSEETLYFVNDDGRMSQAYEESNVIIAIPCLKQYARVNNLCRLRY